MKIAVIGGVAAGLTAASRIKKENSNNEVVVFEESGDVSYGACGMPYNISMPDESPESLYALSHKQITQKRNVDYRLNTSVKSIDTDRNELYVYDSVNRNEYKYDYDYLVCATGASENKLNIEGFDDNVFYFKTLEHLRILKNYIYREKPKKACLVGAGYINLELAENLAKMGIEVTLLQKPDKILPFLLDDARDFAEGHLQDKGVDLHTGVDILKKDGNTLKTNKGDFYCDFVVVAIGVSPNTELFKNTNIDLGMKNAVKVNHYLQTNVNNIYAAGDCAEHYFPLLKDWTYMPLGTTANKMGRIAGFNIVNSHNQKTFHGINQTAAFRLFDISLATTGLFESQLKNNNFNYEQTTISIPDKPKYIGGKKQVVTLFYDKSDGRIYGCQITGYGTVAKRVDIISTAINAGMTLEDFSTTDLSYAPPFANVWDSILVAVNVSLKNL